MFANDVLMFDHYSPDVWSKFLGLLKNKIVDLRFVDKIINEYINTAFTTTVLKYQPNIIFLFKCKNIYPETIKKLRNKGFIIVNWYPDYYDDWQWIRTHAKNYDYFFTPCEYVLKKLKEIKVTAYYIPFASEPDTEYVTKPKKYQATFVGRFTARRSQLFKKVFDADLLDIWGYRHWQTSKFNSKYHGEITPSQTLEIIRNSKITLNTLTGTDDTPIMSVNYRVFEATGVGGFVLTSYHPPLEKFYKIGKEIEIFKSAEEALAKTRFYLKHDTLREKIARAGWERTKRDHTYLIRLRKLFSYIDSSLDF